MAKEKAAHLLDLDPEEFESRLHEIIRLKGVAIQHNSVGDYTEANDVFDKLGSKTNALVSMFERAKASHGRLVVQSAQKEKELADLRAILTTASDVLAQYRSK